MDCWGLYKQNNIVNIDRVEDSTAELGIIASSDEFFYLSFFDARKLGISAQPIGTIVQY